MCVWRQRLSNAGACFQLNPDAVVIGAGETRHSEMWMADATPRLPRALLAFRKLQRRVINTATDEQAACIRMKRTKFRGFDLFHNNQDAAESMIRQIDEFPSFFTPDGDRPLIVDCGANIGISVLEWKTRWPQAEIICFEPDPFAFEILQLNVDKNDIAGIKCINAAVSDREGTADFFGDLSPAADARGNSLEAAWADRQGSSKTSVQCARLSPYLVDRDVSFLKLDIEGFEQRVLEEIADCLARVEALYVEVHETDESIAVNSVASIEELLSTAGFTIEKEARHGEHALPSALDQWQHDANAVLTQLLCWR